MTHICVNKLTIIVVILVQKMACCLVGANPLSNDGLLLIHTLVTNVSEISVMKMHLEMTSRKWRPFCLGRNVLTLIPAWLHRKSLGMEK